MKKGLLLASVLLALPLQWADAGPFADDMAKCMVTSTSPQDRTVLMRWIFSLITLHPDLVQLSSISDKQRQDLTKDAGVLFQNLLLDSCKTQTQQAIQNEGPQTIQYAFQVLGQAASLGLFSDPSVTAGAKDLEKYVDEVKLKALAAPEAPKQ